MRGLKYHQASFYTPKTLSPSKCLGHLGALGALGYLYSSTVQSRTRRQGTSSRRLCSWRASWSFTSMVMVSRQGHNRVNSRKEALEGPLVVHHCLMLVSMWTKVRDTPSLRLSCLARLHGYCPHVVPCAAVHASPRRTVCTLGDALL